MCVYVKIVWYLGCCTRLILTHTYIGVHMMICAHMCLVTVDRTRDRNPETQKRHRFFVFWTSRSKRDAHTDCSFGHMYLTCGCAPQVLGKGSFGEVVRGEWLGTTVAIKRYVDNPAEQTNSINEFESELQVRAHTQCFLSRVFCLMFFSHVSRRAELYACVYGCHNTKNASSHKIDIQQALSGISHIKILRFSYAFMYV